MLVATVFERSQEMFILTKQSVQRPFHMISHVAQSLTLHVTAARISIPSQKNSIKFGTLSLAFIGYMAY